MTRSALRLRVRVIAVTSIKTFSGEAILAQVDPKYVVSAVLVDSNRVYKPNDSEVSFVVHDLAFFAIHSVAKTFLETEIVGKTYDLRLEMDTVGDIRTYLLLPDAAH